MKGFKDWAMSLVFAAHLIAAVVQGLRCDTSSIERNHITREAMDRLRATGDFEVIQGNLSFNHRQIGNPAGRYGTVNLPHWSQPPLLCNASHNPAGASLPFSFCNLAFVLGPRDALVWLGCTPPPAAYFSLRSYVAFKFDPQFWFPAAELGDPANHLVLNSTGGPEDPFGKTAMMLSTGDEETARMVNSAFVEAGMPSSIANLDIIPADMATFRDRSKLWVQDRSDAFAWQFRVSQFADPQEADEYFAEVWPVYYLRAKPHYSRAGPKPLAPPPARVHGNGVTQAKYEPSLQELEKRVVDAYAAQGSVLSYRFPMDHVIPDIERCLVDPTYMPIFQPVPAWGFPGWASCDWFSADALYTILPNTTDLGALTFPVNRTYVVLGVNQPKLEKAIYSNLMVSSVVHFEDPLHAVNLTAKELQGSASQFAGDLEGADDLWVHSFDRDCSLLSPPELRPFCRDIPTSMINETEFLFVVERKYLEPETRTGPAPEEIKAPLVLIFDKIMPVPLSPSSPDEIIAAASFFGQEEEEEEEGISQQARRKRKMRRSMA